MGFDDQDVREEITLRLERPVRLSLVRRGALGAVVCGLSSVALGAGPPSQERDTCALATRDLRGQIEAMKVLKAKAPSLAFDEPSRMRKGPERPETLLARARAQADALNAMLPGMGCASLDIDRELAQPLNAALLPSVPAGGRKHSRR